MLIFDGLGLRYVSQRDGISKHKNLDETISLWDRQFGLAQFEHVTTFQFSGYFSILKIDTFKIKIKKWSENEKNTQVVTRANWTSLNLRSYYEVVSSSSKTSCSQKTSWTSIKTIPNDKWKHQRRTEGTYIMEQPVNGGFAIAAKHIGSTVIRQNMRNEPNTMYIAHDLHQGVYSRQFSGAS